MPHPDYSLIPDFADLLALREENEDLRARLKRLLVVLDGRPENEGLHARLERLTQLDLECAHDGLRDIAGVARKYIPAEHQETALYLLALAYMRGRGDEISKGYSPVIVLRACPVCTGKSQSPSGERQRSRGEG